MENQPSKPEDDGNQSGDATAEPSVGAATGIPSVSSIEVPGGETTDLPDDATDSLVSSTMQTVSGENSPANSAASDEDASTNLTTTRQEAKVIESEVEEPKKQAFFEGGSPKTSSAPLSSRVTLDNEGSSDPMEYYEMRNDEKKGFFLVFCHEEFKNRDLECLPMRRTSIELQNTWEEFGFIFDVHYNLTRDKIFEVINKCFVSLSHKTYGSVFLETLNDCIKDSASVDILTILTKVIQKVAERKFEVRRGMIKQCPTILSRLTKQVVLRAPEQQNEITPSVYEEQNSPGIFLIFIQKYSNGTVRQDFKDDAENLRTVLRNLGFEVDFQLFSDEANIINHLKRDAKKPENRKCFACVVLSVGVDGYEIFAEESDYHYKHMIQPFIDRSEWVGKPKLFFIQANINEAMCSHSKQRDYYPRNVSLSPEEADVLIMFSPDNPTEERTGSKFINSLTDCIWRYRRNLDLLTILTKVVGEVARVETVSGQEYNLCPTIVSRLTKQFYFSG